MYFYNGYRYRTMSLVYSNGQEFRRFEAEQEAARIMMFEQDRQSLEDERTKIITGREFASTKRRRETRGR